MGSVIYNRYSDNLAAGATITVETGTAATGYDPSWIADYDASRPLKLNETSGAVLFDMGTAKQVKIAAIFHANFQESLAVHLQANATNSWGAPSLDVTITTPAWKAGRTPGQPWVDLRSVSGAGSYRYWRLQIPSANAVPIAIGDVWLGSEYRSFGVKWEDVPKISRPQIEHQTDYKKLRFPLGYTARLWSGTVPVATDLVRDAILDWILDADGRPVLFIPESGASVPEAWLALHADAMLSYVRNTTDASTFAIEMEEDGRGLEPTPSPL